MHLTENKLSPAHSSVSFVKEKNYCWLWAYSIEHIIALCQQNAELLNVTAGGPYSLQRVSNSQPDRLLYRKEPDD